jgi:hypothetical protein
LKAKYRLHPGYDGNEFEIPNGDTKIWRYLDFTKFFSMLENKALFFCRSDKLGDPFEGSYSKANIRSRVNIYSDWLKKELLTLSILYKDIRRFTIINCWNINECESSSLWSLYAGAGRGIAIQSTVDRLKKCFGCELESGIVQGVFIAKVKYIDYNNEKIPEGSFIAPFLHKRKSFAHENELRAIIVKIPPTDSYGHIDPDKLIKTPDIFDQGENIDVNLENLIENVYVSPLSPNWYRCLVDSVMKKYDLIRTSVISSLDESPVY